MSYASSNNDMLLEESVNWPLVAAAPGFFTVDSRWPNQEPEAVLAWRAGPELTLPVTRHGYRPVPAYVVHPDGKVRFHGLSTFSEVPDFNSIERWRIYHEGFVETTTMWRREPAEAWRAYHQAQATETPF